MDKSTITLLLGITFGLAVVGVIGFIVFVARASSTTASLALTTPVQTYSNEERWSIVKDANGRVKDVVVHREAKQV